MSSNSFCNHTREKEIDFVIIRMITDRIGRHEIEVRLAINCSDFTANRPVRVFPK